MNKKWIIPSLFVCAITGATLVYAASNVLSEPLIMKPSVDAVTKSEPEYDIRIDEVTTNQQAPLLPDEQALAAADRRAGRPLEDPEQTSSQAADVGESQPASYIKPGAAQIEPAPAAGGTSAVENGQRTAPTGTVATAPPPPHAATPSKEQEEEEQMAALGRVPQIPDPPTVSLSELIPATENVPKLPGWVETQRGLDIQFFYQKRALERRAELAKLQADIAQSQASIKQALTPEDAESNDGARMGLTVQRYGGPGRIQPTPDNSPDPALLAMATAAEPAVARPPPPPAAPVARRILGDYAVLDYDGGEYTVTRGDTLPDDYRVTAVSYGEVILVDAKKQTLRLSPQW